MDKNSNDTIALTLLSLILIMNICCCNMISAILGIVAILEIIKSKNEKCIENKYSYISRAKILLTVGYAIFVINIVIGFIIDIVIKVLDIKQII